MPRHRPALRIVAMLPLLLVLLPAAVRALDPDRRLTQHQLEQWGTEEGLPQSTVRAIAQDSRGYLWFGTQEGAGRFDGVGFRIYDTSTIAGLRTGYVVSMITTPGNLWLGVNDGGLALIRADGSSRWWGAEHGLPSESVYALRADPAGGLWVGTRAGLARLEGGRVDGAPCRGIGEAAVLNLLPDGRDSVLVATTDGLFRCRNGVASVVAFAGELVRTVSRPRSRPGLWVTTDTGLFELRDGVVTRRWTSADGLPHDDVLRLLEDRDGNLWIGTDGGLARLTGDRLERFPADHPLGRLSIRALFEDREGSVWVGTDGAGVFRLHDAGFVVVGEEDGMRSAAALSVLEDAAGRVWAGTEDGLFELVNGLARRVDTPFQRLVWALAESPAGRLWVGTADGLWMRQGERWRRFEPPSGRDVRALLVDSRARLWAGTDVGGLSRLDGDRLVDAFPPGTPPMSVWNLAEDVAGGLWIATAGSGLLELRGAELRAHGPEQGLASTAIVALRADPDGTLWVGTQGHGLFRRRGGRFFRFHRDNGLSEELVHHIVDDGRGNLWLASNRGILRVARAELDAVAAGRRPRLSPTRFGRAEGLATPETNGGQQPPAMRSRDGRLWFSTMAGVAIYDPARPHKNSVPPNVWIDELRADDVAMVPAAGARLPADTRRVEVRLAALSFRAPERVRVRYRLLGSHPEWVEVGAQRSAFFTNLPPGPLELEVVAANEDGVWSRQPARLSFSRAPRLHEAWWFLPALAGLLLLVAWAGHRLRLRQVRGRFQAVLDERARLGRELHDTIAQGLAGIGMQVETAAALVDRDRERARTHLGRAGELVRSSHEEVRRSIRALRPAALERRDLGEALVAEARDAGERFGVVVAVKRRGRPRELHPEAETEVLRIGQEAVGNALRHGRPQRVELDITWERRRLVVRVRDDGAGFDPAAPRLPRTSGGFGLYGMAERAKKIGAELIIDSRPGEGTSVQLHVPLRGRGGTT
jgi:ligand-binding sensor domain-containing protein/signal transduction histidine kinase